MRNSRAQTASRRTEGDVKGQFAKSCRLALEELRAWATFEITEDLHQRAQDDWARYGRLRLRWENRFRDPKDVLIEAERLKKKLAEEAAKKQAKKQGGSHEHKQK